MSRHTMISQSLADELRAAVRGDVLFDAVSRALYATDASIYQATPHGVVCPRDAEDVAAVLRVARRYGVPLLARGGGTSLAGQVVGRGIQLDFSRYMHRVLEVNAAEGWAWVEPGIVLDELNAQLAAYGLKFAPDVAPANRATIGGMIGNNSSGMYSLAYGKTIDHVLELRVMLADGSVAQFGPLGDDELRAKLLLDNLEGRAYCTVRRLAREHAEEIDRRFPKLLRRVGGYNLDAFVPMTNHRPLAIDEQGHAESSENNGGWPMVGRRAFNMANIVVGAEGTLALVTAAKLRLVPRLAHTAIGILAFASLDEALAATLPCLACQPAAVELMDDILLGLTRASPQYARYLASFVQGEPGALLQVEFFGDTPAAVRADLDRLEAQVRAAGVPPFTFTRAVTPEARRAVLEVRKAGLPLLQSLSPDLKPETFVEDSAVAPERLRAYVQRFRQICAEHGVQVAFYGHASVGLLHARPLINLKRAEDVRTMRAIAEAIRDLVLEFGGALSGEHGDGMLRAEFNRALFGDALYEAFREVKRTFDPRGLLNPGKIVDAPPMDTQLRYGPGYRVRIPLETHFRFADTSGMAGAAELCNGNGLCRKTASGTMCPSYMVTRDEQHSTRGRANALRMVLSGALPPAELTGERMHAVMDLCLECKGCTGECPSRVNMTRLKSEWLTHYHAEHGVSLRTRLFANIRQLNRLGSALAPLANVLLALPGVPVLQERLLGISRHRRLPTFARVPFHTWFARRQRPGVNPAARAVVLFPDTFTDYNEPQVARAAVRVLEAAGYRVLLPARRVCCGRPLISKGQLGGLRALAQQQLAALAPYLDAGLPIIGLEPSCILTFRDELPDMLDDPCAQTLARQSFLFDEFLADEIRAGRTQLSFQSHNDSKPQSTETNPLAVESLCLRGNSDTRSFLLHGHCHQKALASTAPALALLRLIPGADVRELDSGCCGMAGSFGYEAEHYAISQAIGERVLLPAVRALAPNTTVVALGASCRQQIADGTGWQARHLAEVLADALA